MITAVFIACLLQTDVVPPARAVDDARCEDCHPDQTLTWRRSGMGRALEEIDPAAFEGLGEVAAGETGYAYRFDVTGGGVFVLENYRTEQSEPPREVNRWPLRFAVGAGDLDRSFAMEVDGRWWLAPLELVSAHVTRRGVVTDRHAALAPAHGMQPLTRATQAITPECLACHTQNLPTPDWPLNRALGGESWRPTGISCGACHGRAEAHADWREEDLAGGEVQGQDPLRSHAGFTREERMSICAACHLQGDARLELVPRRFGVPEPGGDLLALRALFVAAEVGPELGFASQTERLVLSECYLQTPDLTCETCHDPHRSVYEPRESARVRGACVGCHGGERPGTAHTATPCSEPVDSSPDGQDCADCHMPESPVFDVAGVRIHDHWIRRRPRIAAAPDELRFDEAPDGNWRRFRWPGVAPPEHIDDAGLLLMALASRGHWQAAAALLEERPGPAAVRLPMYHHVKAGVLEAVGRTAEAERAYRVALALDPQLAAATVNLGLLLARTDRARDALTLLSATIEAHPLLDSALRNRALAHGALGDGEAFARDLERAFRLRPEAELALALAEHYERSGDRDRARRWRSEASRVRPDLARE